MMDYMRMHQTNQFKVGDIYLYTVKKGDDLYRIAQMFQSDVHWIQCMNHLNKQGAIYPRMQLYIPVLKKQIEHLQPYRESYDLYF